MTATRPVLRYHGGKWRLAEWILSHFPKHSVYLEPYCGAASVFMQKPRVESECLNDLDGRICDVFRCLRDPVMAAELRRRLYLTPFARQEFDEADLNGHDFIDRVRRTIVKAFMGRSTDALARKYKTAFRCRCSHNRALSSNEWASWPDQVPAYVERLRGVAIENRDALEVIQRLDGPKTLHYVDPPYPHKTRTSKHGYRHEMTDDQHRELAAVLRGCRGAVVLSGYACDLYVRELYPDWTRVEHKALADGAKQRTEVLWLNQEAARNQPHPRIFG